MTALAAYGRAAGRDDLLGEARAGLARVWDWAFDMVRWSHAAGWDDAHGGLYYFLDAGGYSPVQLEWSMKLWWVHYEALYAHLLTYWAARPPWRRHRRSGPHDLDQAVDVVGVVVECGRDAHAVS